MYREEELAVIKQPDYREPLGYAVMRDLDRPCLFHAAGPCFHPKCLEAHYDTLLQQRRLQDALAANPYGKGLVENFMPRSLAQDLFFCDEDYCEGHEFEYQNCSEPGL